MTRDDRIEQMIPAEAISDRIATLGREIEMHFAGTERLVVVGVLRGAFVFVADLVRALDLETEVEFLEVSSYGNATERSGEIRLRTDLRGDIAGADVLVVEDIVDTGHTLRHVLDLLAGRNPARLEAVALLDKPARREVAVQPRWIGFEIPNAFVLGYGIDYAQRGRGLPYIGVVAT